MVQLAGERRRPFTSLELISRNSLWRDEPIPADLVEAMQSVDIEAVVTVQARGMLRGLLCLGPKAGHGVYLPEELSLTRTIAGKVIAGMESAAARQAQPEPEPDEIVEGALLDRRYRIERLLGEGGAGSIYLAHDQRLELDVALKLVRRDQEADPRGEERLYQEVKLARRVSHRNVARIHDIGASARRAFITMEHVEGQTLAQRLKGAGRLELDEAREVLRQICAGLGAAHEAGVIHRDLKPHNIMLEPGGRVVILDFGIARWTSGAGQGGDGPGAGGVAGTPHYMAPEQFEGREVARGADIYALGVVAHELLTGSRPFEADTPLELAFKHTEEPPPDPASLRSDLPPRMAAMILRCLEKEPRRRFDSVQEIVDLLA